MKQLERRSWNPSRPGISISISITRSTLPLTGYSRDFNKHVWRFLCPLLLWFSLLLPTLLYEARWAARSILRPRRGAAAGATEYQGQRMTYCCRERTFSSAKAITSTSSAGSHCRPQSTHKRQANRGSFQTSRGVLYNEGGSQS